MNAFDKFDDTELTILLYHGVTDNYDVEVRNANRKHLHVDVFREQMKILKLNCNVVSMDEVLWHLEEQKSFPSKTVAVTFDDGFKNNYSFAAPILDSLKIPAIFYLSSGLINTNLMFFGLIR